MQRAWWIRGNIFALERRHLTRRSRVRQRRWMDRTGNSRDQITAATRTRATTKGDRFRLEHFSSCSTQLLTPSFVPQRGAYYQLACEYIRGVTRIAYFAELWPSLVMKRKCRFFATLTDVHFPARIVVYRRPRGPGVHVTYFFLPMRKPSAARFDQLF